MNRYKEIAQQYNRVLQQIEELNLEYEGKIKGDVYTKRKNQLYDKRDALMKKAKILGTTGNVVHVQGQRSRPAVRNKQVLIKERFNLYFINVHEDEISSLIKLHVPNVDFYKVSIYRPGMIITSS